MAKSVCADIKMIFPRRLTLALSLICCSQHANASTSSMKTSMSTAQASSSMTAQASSSMTAQASSSITAQASSHMMATGSTSAVTKTIEGTSSTIITMGRTSTTATGISTTTNASTTATGMSTSITYMQSASFSIGTEYASPDCESCSIGGTITVTMSCSIKIEGSVDKKCDEDTLNQTICDYVTLADKGYQCDEVKNNYSNIVEKKVKIEKDCDVVCPASGSVLYPRVVFTFASGLVVGMLSQTL